MSLNCQCLTRRVNNIRRYNVTKNNTKSNANGSYTSIQHPRVSKLDGVIKETLNNIGNNFTSMNNYSNKSQITLDKQVNDYSSFIDKPINSESDKHHNAAPNHGSRLFLKSNNSLKARQTKNNSKRLD